MVEKIFAGEDQYDQGGCFIISGNARTLATQVRDAYNKIHVFEKIKNDRLCLISEMRSMSFETRHSVLIHIHQYVMVSNQLYGKDVHKMYDHRHLFLSMPQRDSCNNIMIAYVIAILLLQRDGMIKISTSPTAPTVTPELINRLGSRWNTMLKRLMGNKKEFKPALDSMLDEMLILVKTSGIETIQHKTDYLQNKRAPGGKNLFELIKDFFHHLGIKYSPDQILIQLGMMIRKMLRSSALGLPIEDK